MKANIIVLLLALPFLGYAQIEEIPVDSEEKEVLKEVEEMPRFFSRECEALSDLTERRNCSTNALLQFIYQEIKYPETARMLDVEGTIVITFIIEKDGTITDPTIVREIGGGCGAEGLRVVKLMPNWIPGYQEGEPVRVQFNFPIKFKLDGRKKKRKKNKQRKSSLLGGYEKSSYA